MEKLKILMCLVLFVGFATVASSGNIIYPWRSTTAIVKSGQTFEVWFNASVGQTVSSIQLKSEYLTVSTTKSTVTGNWKYDPLSGNTYNQKITVTVPSSTPADRYDLVLVTSSGNVTSYGGVKVINDYKADYYVMHWSDGHIFQSGYDTTVLLKRKSLMVDIANIIDAEIIVETGDNMYNVRNHPNREDLYFRGSTKIGTKGMANAKAATFLVPGDHCALNGNDFNQATPAENSDFFNDYWGMQCHYFKYGNARFLNFNNAWGLTASSNGVYQYQVDNALSWLDGAGSGGNFLVSSGHCYDRIHHFVNSSKPLDLVLAGDKHHSGSDNPWSISTGGPSIAYIVNSIRDHFQFNIYKINNAAGTFSKPAGATAMVDVIYSGDQNVPSTWVPNLELTYLKVNNGTFSANTATIVNRFNFPISGAKVRFVLPKGNVYSVTNGTKVQEFDGTSVHVYDVAVDLAANSTTNVSIATATISVTGVAVSPTTASLTVGDTQQLTATVMPSNATNKAVSWSTSNASVATVNSSGLVTAVSAGTATITVATQDGGKTATSVMTVNAPASGIQVLQAEDAAYGGAIVANNQTGYNGTGFIDYQNNSADYVQWAVNVPTSGSYDLTFRYALPSGGRPLELKVNGVVKVASLDFPATGLWTTWSTVSTAHPLNAGNNTVRLTSIGSNGGNIDELVVTPLNYLDECESLTGWSSNGANTLSLDTSNEMQGTSCVQMVGSGTDEFKKVFSPAFNSGATVANGVLKFWYYVSDVTKLSNGGQVEISSSGGPDVNEYSWSLLTGLTNGWNEVRLNISDANVTGTPNLSAINWFRIYHTKSASITTRVDGIQLISSSLLKTAKLSAGVSATVPGQTEKSVDVYPNPYSQGNLHLDMKGFEDAGMVHVKILSLAGQVVYEETLANTQQAELNLSGKLHESVYLISIESEKTRIVKRLVVR